MQMMIEFDVNAGIIEVPQFVIDDRELYRRRFLRWLYDKNVHHKYWVHSLMEKRGFVTDQMPLLNG